MFKLDLNRLHKVFLKEGKISERQFGNTTAVCYQAIGFIQVLSYFDIFILVNHFHDIKSIEDVLINSLNEQNIQYKVLKRADSFEIHIFNSKNRIIITSKRSYEKWGNDNSHNEHLLLFDFWNDGISATSVQWRFDELLDVFTELTVQQLEKTKFELGNLGVMKDKIEINKTIL